MARLPDLGPHGEGWFILQIAVFVIVAVSGLFGPVWGGPPYVAGAASGVVLVAAGGYLSMRGVLDLRKNLTPFPKPLAGASLVDTGAYGLVRHPIYGGFVLAAVGWALLRASAVGLLAAALTAAFFRLKSTREEAWLAEAFPAYDEYRLRTKRLIPWLY